MTTCWPGYFISPNLEGPLVKVCSIPQRLFYIQGITYLFQDKNFIFNLYSFECIGIIYFWSLGIKRLPSAQLVFTTAHLFGIKLRKTLLIKKNQGWNLIWHVFQGRTYVRVVVSPEIYFFAPNFFYRKYIFLIIKFIPDVGEGDVIPRVLYNTWNIVPT